MKRIVWAWLAISSVLFALAHGEMRPRYGGTLHVTMRAAPMSLDPIEMAGNGDSFGGRGLVFLLFDTLVTVDDAGRAQPSLAESWQSSRGNQHWEFHLRQGVKFQDGTALTGEIAAASLRAANSAWKISADGNTVVIDVDSPNPEMLAELALPRNAIAKRDQQFVGTGPFAVAQWQSGKSVTLTANEECWRGRPFLDTIEIGMGRTFRDQMNAFDMVERLMLLASDGQVDLPTVESALPRSSGSISSSTIPNGSGPLAERVQAFEREVILAELKRNHNNMSLAAKSLGLERSHLYKKAEQLGIDLRAIRREQGAQD